MVAFDADGRAETIEENVDSEVEFCGDGSVFYNGQAVAHAHAIEPSPHGELEITGNGRA